MTISLQELATKLNGKFWSKEGKERVYLDRGYNTKKMSTSTYVEQSENGLFVVKCFVKCDSQDYNWCESQANQVIESVENQIKEALATEYFYVVNEETNQAIDDCQTAKPLADLYIGGGLYLREGFAKNFIKREDIEGFKVMSISRSDYESLEVESISDEKIKNEVKELLIGKTEFEKKNIAFNYFQKTEKENLKNYFLEMFEYYKGISIDGIENVTEPIDSLLELIPIKKVNESGSGVRVKHARFGLGEIIEEFMDGDNKKFKILFESVGEKSLLERFANLTFL